MGNSITTIYHSLIEEGKLKSDAAQEEIVTYLDQLQHRLLHRYKQRNSLYGKLRRKIKIRKPISGLYLWGKVGTGKTMLIDLLYDHLPVPKKRQHFFEFMKELHNELKIHQGQKDPLKIIAISLAKRYHVIFFDEFFVKNIADAMLLAELFESLFQHGLCLVTTSNLAPDNLYQEGLQRERFLPAIALLQKHTKTIQIKTTSDYRGTFIQDAGTYYTPLDSASEKAMENAFAYFAYDAAGSNKPLIINQRELPILQTSGKVVWVDFATICETPRSSSDYLALAKRFRVLLISAIPVIAGHDHKAITRFIQLIDILYDNQVGIVLSAADRPENLYLEGPHHFEFQRTLSRLHEMQSSHYLDQLP